jgi:hypothetical protein
MRSEKGSLHKRNPHLLKIAQSAHNLLDLLCQLTIRSQDRGLLANKVVVKIL